MKIVKLFLASSIVEFKREREALTAFVLTLNNEYVRRGVYFEFTICETLSDELVVEGKQEEYNAMIRESDLVYFLLGREVGTVTEQEFDVAHEQCGKYGKPGLFVFFKNVQVGVSAGERLAPFRKKLDGLRQPYTDVDELVDAVRQSLEGELRREGDAILQTREGQAMPEGGKMTFITLFLASSPNVRDEEPHEFVKNERNEISTFIASLNDRYIKRGKYFELKIGADLSRALADKHDPSIRGSQFFYVVFGRKDERHIREEFDVALAQRKASGAPRIFTYFRKLPDGVSPEADVTAFMERLDKEIGHYYSRFDHLDTVKLNMLIELARSPEVSGLVKFEEGKATLDGREMFSLENVPLYRMNEAFQKLKAERDRLNEEVAQLAVEFGKNPGDASLLAKLSEAGGRREEANKQLRQMETDMLDLCSTIAERTSSGKPITWREKKASGLLDEGDYEGALAVLRDEERKKELEQAKRVRKEGDDRFRGYISEDRLRIQALKSKGVNTETIPEILQCYEECAELAKEYRVEVDILYEYASFLQDQKDFDKAIETADWLLKYYALETPPEDEFATLKNLLGNLLSATNRLDEAEQFCREALEIRRRLAGQNPAAYDADVAMTCNDLAVLLYPTKRLPEAEQFYREALEIRRRLAGQNPDAYDAYVALTCNNLAILLHTTNRLDEAAGFFYEALETYRCLAGQNPDAYDAEVARTCNNLANLLRDTNWLPEAEAFYREALEISRRLAGQNPDAYDAEVAGICNNLAILLHATNRLDEAETFCREALAIRRRLAGQNPDAYDAEVAMTCSNLANFLSDTNRLPEAEVLYRETLTLFSCLAKANSVYAADVAKTCDNLAILLSATNRLDEAEQFYREALEISRRLAKTNPAAYEAKVAAGCNNLANLLRDTNRFPEAEQFYREALEIRRRLAEANPDAYAADVCKTCGNLAKLLDQAGRSDEAAAYRKLAGEIFIRL